MLPPIEHGETRLVQVRIFAIIFIWEIRQDSRGLGQGLESFFWEISDRLIFFDL